MTAPAPAPNNSSLPPLPDEWKAEWSVQYNRWYYLNLSTGTSQWDFPTLQHQAPAYSKPNTPVQSLAQTYPTPPQFQQGDGDAQESLGADGDRGIGQTVGGGLLGLANGLVNLAAKLGVHEGDKHKIHHFGQSNAPGEDGSQLGQTGVGAPIEQFGTTYVPCGASLGTAPGDIKPSAPIYGMPASSDNGPPGSPYRVSGDTPESISSRPQGPHPGMPPSQAGPGGYVAGLPPALAVSGMPPPDPNAGGPTGPPPPSGMPSTRRHAPGPHRPAGPPPGIIPAGMAPSVHAVPSPPPGSPPAKTGKISSGKAFAGGLAAGGVVAAISTELVHHHGMESSTHSTPPSNYLNPNEPRLYIHCAAYCDKDVTKEVRALVTPEQSLELKGDDFYSHFGDPWPGIIKSFSVIYSYGERPWELIAGANWGGGTFSIIPHQALDTERMAFIQDEPGKLVALVWGFNNGLVGGEGVVAKKERIETTGEFPVNDTWMGGNGYQRFKWPDGNAPKTAIAYYRAEGGVIKFASGREGGTCRMPWNPLAKWT